MDEVQPLAGGELLLSGAAVLWFAVAVKRSAGSRVDGAVDRRAQRWLPAALEAAQRTRVAANGKTAMPPAAPVSSSAVLIDPITIPEAADMLDRPRRTVRWQCEQDHFATACKVGAQWRIERSEVLDHAREAS